MGTGDCHGLSRVGVARVGGNAAIAKSGELPAKVKDGDGQGQSHYNSCGY